MASFHKLVPLLLIIGWPSNGGNLIWILRKAWLLPGCVKRRLFGDLSSQLLPFKFIATFPLRKAVRLNLEGHEKLRKGVRRVLQRDVIFGLTSIRKLFKEWYYGCFVYWFSSSPEYCFPLFLFKKSFLYRVRTLSKL